MRDNINYILVILFLFGGILPGSAVAYDCFKVGNGIYENQGKYYGGSYTMVDDMWLNEGTGVLEFSSHTIEAVTGTYYYHAGSFSVESWDSQNSIWVQTDSKLMSTNQRYLFSDTAKASLDSLMEQSNVHLPSENMETGCSDPDPQPPNPQSHGSQTYKCFKFSNGLYPNQNRYHDGPFTMVDDMWINYDTGKIEYSSYPIDADTDVYHWAAGSFSVQVWDKEELQWITSDSRLMSINEHFVFSTNAKESLENLEAQPEIFPPSEVLPTCSSSKYELDCRSGQGLCVPTCDSSVDLDSDGVSECADCDDSDPAIGADCISPIGPPEKCNDQGFQSNPISIYNGNKFEQVTDLNIPTPNRNGLRLTRYYNSRSSASSVLGHGWSHSFDHTLANNVPFNNSTYLQINHGGGKKYYFSDSGNNRWDGEFHEDSHVIAEGGGYTWYQLDGSTSHFASNGALEWTEDDFGNRQNLAYDQSGFLQTVTDNASGRALTFKYTNNLLTSVSGPASAVVTNGVLVTYSYDSDSNLESATSADGSGLTYEYTDPNDIHNLTAKKDKSGHLIASWGYDSLDRANQSFTRDGQGVTVNYLSDVQAEVSDAYGVTRTYDFVYSKGRKQISGISGSGGCTSCGNDSQPIRYEYDNMFRVVEEEYADGTINQYGLYNTRGQAQKVIYSVGKDEQRAVYSSYHPDLDVKVSQQEYSVISLGNNKETVWDYDDPNAAGDTETPNENPTRLLYRKLERGYTKDSSQEVVAYEYITSYQYNAKGQLTTIDGPLPGNEDTTSFTYDPATGDLLAETRPLVGATTYSGHDAAGNPTQVTDINGQQATLVYDGNNRVLSSAKNGIITSMTYTTDGLVETMTTGAGGTTTYTYDPTYGRLEKVSGPLGNFMSYGYDGQGNRIQESISNSVETVTFQRGYSYQEPTYPGKLWKIVNFDNSETVFSYDPQGNRTSVQNALNKVTSYTYDSQGRLASTIQPGPTVTGYTYDSHGNLSMVTDAQGKQTTYIHDDRGNAVSEISPDTGTTFFTFDAAGNMVSKTDVAGITVSYGYDAFGRLESVSYPDASQNIGYGYDQGTYGKGKLTSLTDPSGSQTFEYDQHGRLTKKTQVLDGLNFITSYGFNNNHQVTSATYPSGVQLTYQRGLDGKVTGIQADGQQLINNVTHLPFGGVDDYTFSAINQTHNRTFDQGYRMTRIQSGSQDYQFTYDVLGRLIEDNGLAEPDYSKRESFSAVYLPGTNKLDTLTDSQGVRQYSYDSNGNITSDGNFTFVYNQENRLVQVKQGEAVIADYLYDGFARRVKKVTAQETILYHYDQRSRLIAETQADGTPLVEYIYLEDEMVAMKKHGSQAGTYFILNDHLATPRTVLNSSGQIVWQAGYFPYGQIDIKVDTITFNIRRPGQYYDAETGLFYNWHRYYDPNTGRYLTPDPIGLNGGMNLFLYTNANPVNFIDPDGKIVVTPAQAQQIWKGVQSWWGGRNGTDFTLFLNNAEFVTDENGCKYVCWSLVTDLIGMGATWDMTTASVESPVTTSVGYGRNLSVSADIPSIINGPNLLNKPTTSYSLGLSLGSPLGTSVRLKCFLLTEKGTNGCSCDEEGGPNAFF